MKSLKWMASSLIVAIVLVMAAPARADYYFGSNYSIDPDWNSGYGNAWSGGQNFMATDVSSTMSTWYDPGINAVMITGNVTVRGNLVDPGISGPIPDFMENEGLSTSINHAIQNFDYNGEQYDLYGVVNASLYGHTGIWRNEEHTELTGESYAYMSCEGAIPVDSWSSLYVFQGDLPPWQPEVEFSMGFRMLVVTGFEAVPAPGALALLGTAGLVGHRRRRREI